MAIRTLHHDSPLGRWLMADWRPAHLAGLVELIWYFDGAIAFPRERVFPNGRVSLIVHLGPRYSRVEGTCVEPYSTCCVGGLQLRSMVIQAPPGPSAVLGIVLHPAAAFAVLGQPLHELAGITVDLEELIAAASAELHERCASAGTGEERVRTAAAWVAERVARGPVPDPAVAWAARVLEERAGAISIAALRERTGWSKSRFTATFKEQVGVPPKVLARLLRFRRAIELVHGESLPLAEIAHTTGYYDQPHFSAEFREIAGFPPSDFLAARRYPESVSLPEPAS